MVGLPYEKQPAAWLFYRDWMCLSSVQTMFGTLLPNYRISAKSINVNCVFYAKKFVISKRFQQIAHPFCLNLGVQTEGMSFGVIF